MSIILMIFQSKVTSRNLLNLRSTMIYTIMHASQNRKQNTSVLHKYITKYNIIKRHVHWIQINDAFTLDDTTEKWDTSRVTTRKKAASKRPSPSSSDLLKATCQMYALVWRQNYCAWVIIYLGIFNAIGARRSYWEHF